MRKPEYRETTHRSMGYVVGKSTRCEKNWVMSLSVDVRKVVDVEVVRRAGVGSRMRPMVWVNVADQGEAVWTVES